MIGDNLKKEEKDKETFVDAINNAPNPLYGISYGSSNKSTVYICASHNFYYPPSGSGTRPGVHVHVFYSPLTQAFIEALDKLAREFGYKLVEIDFWNHSLKFAKFDC